METSNNILILFSIISIFNYSALGSVKQRNKDDSAPVSVTRFEVCNKTVEKYQPRNTPSHPTIIKILEKEYSTGENISELLHISIDTTKNVSFQPNGFVSTVLDAYAGHHNLVLRPDDIWTAIMTQFSFYLNKNAEKYRHKFVKHTGQKELKVTLGGTLRSASYSQFVQLMTAKIDQNLLDKTVKDWVLPNFSTTTEDDIVSVGVIFMASQKQYFSYTFEIICGIPEIALEGTLEDWKDIHSRLAKLKEFELDWWYEKLDIVLKQFIAAKEGNIDNQFWKSIVNKNKVGCGSPVIHGWLTVFSVFNDEGIQKCGKEENYPFLNIRHTDFSLPPKYAFSNSGGWFVCDLNDLPNGMAAVNVKIIDHGVEYKSIMYGGHFGTESLEDGYTLRPTIGWISALLKEN